MEVHAVIGKADCFRACLIKIFQEFLLHSYLSHITVDLFDIRIVIQVIIYRSVVNIIFRSVGIELNRLIIQGIVFIILFSVHLKWLPSGGRMPVGEHGFFSRVPYLVLPVMTMAISLTAALVRYTKNSMLDVMGKDYIKTARSKGLRETTVSFKHAFRNSLIPTMTLIVMRLPRLVGGSAVIETVFNYPGIGNMALTALNAGDIPVVMITTMTTGVMVLLSSTLVDIVTAMLDPRIRLG